MGISVNSAISPVSTTLSGSFPETIQDVALVGDFAGLLSKELNNLLLSPAVASTELTKNAAPESMTKDLDKDIPFTGSVDASTMQIDPSLIASLNAATQIRASSIPPTQADLSVDLDIEGRSNSASVPPPVTDTDTDTDTDTSNTAKILNNAQFSDLKLDTFKSHLTSATSAPPETQKTLTGQLTSSPTSASPPPLPGPESKQSPIFNTIAISNETRAQTPIIEQSTPSPGPQNIGAQQVTNLDHHIESKITTHLQDKSWSQNFGDQIVWIAKSAVQSAQISINPPELGPMQITLNLTGDQAKLSFASPHLEVRQAIESAMPHLKEMLSSSGINLGQTNVGAHLPQQQREAPSGNTNGKRITDENAILKGIEGTLTSSSSAILQRGRGLVDLFA